MRGDNISHLFEDNGDDDDEGSFPDDLWNILDNMDLDARVVHLTVSESKRLIAKGIAHDGRVQEAMAAGTVAVCKGTTNAYVLEELLGKDIEKGKYVLGNTVPAKSKDASKAFKGSIPEVIFVNGDPVPGLTLEDALEKMEPGDVVLKGANALDYQNKLAGVLIGHPTGGTMGKIIGSVYGKGLHLIVPVGLEKLVAHPLQTTVGVSQPAQMVRVDAPRLWVFQASIFTEIEALQELADVETVQVGAGGVCGAEGAVWLLMSGMTEDIERAMSHIEKIQGEPSFWDAVMRS